MATHNSTTPLTETPIEWATIPQVCRMFGISRSGLYEALRTNLVRGKVIRKPGNVSGRRVISVESVRLWFDSLPEN